MDEVEVVVAHSERATLRVGDVFLKVDADQTRIDVEVEAIALAPVPTPEVLWRKPPLLPTQCGAQSSPGCGDFGADWCPDCVVLGTTFIRPATAKLLSGYHVVRVDVGEFDHNLDIAAPYVNLRSSGIPALTVVNSAGHIEVATNGGEFANARSMPESQVDAFLKKWA